MRGPGPGRTLHYINSNFSIDTAPTHLPAGLQLHSALPSLLATNTDKSFWNYMHQVYEPSSPNYELIEERLGAPLLECQVHAQLLTGRDSVPTVSLPQCCPPFTLIFTLWLVHESGGHHLCPGRAVVFLQKLPRKRTDFKPALPPSSNLILIIKDIFSL